VSIGPGAESITIELWAISDEGARWDHDIWDGPHGWAGAESWVAVDCQVAEASWRWGASDAFGILSVAEPSELDLNTYDPARVLDPMNAASPVYGYVKPGVPLRVLGLAPDPVIAATVMIEEATYDLATGTGRIRAVGPIGSLAQVQLAEGATLPNTLRARVRAVVAATAPWIAVEPELTDPEPDPAVAAHDGKSAPAWAVISAAATDALWFVWTDPAGMVRMRSFGGFPPAPVSLGCAPADPTGLWLEGLTTIGTLTARDGVRNTVRAWSAPSVFAPAVVDPVSVDLYGPVPFEIERVVPAYSVWAGRILEDRGDAGLEVTVGEVRPYDVAELRGLLDLGLLGPCVVRVRDDAHGAPIDLELNAVGCQVGVTAGGWRFTLTTMLSRVEWDNIEPPVVPPIEPPPDPWHLETRVYQASVDALLALTSGGAKYGAGAANSLPVGGWQGWTYRSAVKFASISWTKVRAVKSATLHLRTTDQIRVGFGGNPKLEVRRITEGWTAGSSSSPSSGNAVVWPGPSTTTSGAVVASMPNGEGADKSISVTAIVRAWAPVAAGGSAAGYYGLMLREVSSGESNTTEVVAEEIGGNAAEAYLTVELEIFD